MSRRDANHTVDDDAEPNEQLAAPALAEVLEIIMMGSIGS
jgi:hypothetical protein